MKKVLAMVLCIAISITTLAACSSPKPGAPAGGGTTTPVEGKVMKLKLGHHINDSHVCAQAPLDFAQNVKDATGGKIQIDVYGNSQLGTQAENAEAVRMGTLDFALNDFPTLATVYPKADIVALPYLFSDYKHVRAFFASDECANLIEEIAEASNVRVLAPAYEGLRLVWSKNKVSSVDDMKGLKIRVPDIPLYVSTFDSLGCATTIVSYSEIYTALQTGVVDGLENGPFSIEASALYEQTKYAARTNHILCDTSLVGNEKLLKSFDDTTRQQIMDSAKKAAADGMDRVDKAVSEVEGRLADKGMVFVDVDTEPFRAACKGVWDNYSSKVKGGQELIDFVVSLDK